MSAELWVNDAAVARQIREIWVNDAGTARKIQEIWVNDSGVARLIYQGAVVSISDTTVSRVTTTPASATASYALESDGDILGTLSADIGDWITPTSAAGGNYECRTTVLSGTLTSGTTGAWMALSTTRTWTLTQSGIGTNTASVLIEIRRTSDSVVLDSATITFNAEVSP